MEMFEHQSGVKLFIKRCEVPAWSPTCEVPKRQSCGRWTPTTKPTRPGSLAILIVVMRQCQQPWHIFNYCDIKTKVPRSVVIVSPGALRWPTAGDIKINLAPSFGFMRYFRRLKRRRRRL